MIINAKAMIFISSKTIKADKKTQKNIRKFIFKIAEIQFFAKKTTLMPHADLN